MFLKRFKKLAHSLADKSPTKAAARLGSITIPMKPEFKTQDEATRYVKDLASCAGRQIGAWSPTGYIQLVINQSAYEAHIASIDALTIALRSPNEAIDYICGAVIRQVGGTHRYLCRSYLNTFPVNCDFDHAEIYGAMMLSEFYTRQCMSMIAGALAVLNAHRQYKGWQGFHKAAMPDKDQVKELNEFIANTANSLASRVFTAVMADMLVDNIVVPSDILTEFYKFQKVAMALPTPKGRSISKPARELALNLLIICGEENRHTDSKYSGHVISPVCLYGADVPPRDGDKQESEDDKDSEEGDKTESSEKYCPFKNMRKVIEMDMASGSAPLSSTGSLRDMQVQWTDRTKDGNNGHYGQMEPRYVDEVKSDALPLSRQIGDILLQVHRPPVRQLGYRSGSLDEAVLHRGTYDDTVYYRTPDIDHHKVEVAILVDESGSMAHRIRSAAILCYALGSALSKSPKVRLSYYGHTTNYDKVAMAEYSLDTVPYMRALSENADGYAINAVAEKLRYKRAKRKIMILIADGLPSVSAKYQGDKAVAHTRDAVRSLRDMGIEFMCIGLDRCIDPTTGHQMYGAKYYNTRSTELSGSVVRFLKNAL
jgi:hypothetical protein